MGGGRLSVAGGPGPGSTGGVGRTADAATRARDAPRGGRIPRHGGPGEGNSPADPPGACGVGVSGARVSLLFVFSDLDQRTARILALMTQLEGAAARLREAEIECAKVLTEIAALDEMNMLGCASPGELG